MEQHEPYLSPAQIERRFPGAHRDYEIRELAYRRHNPLPHIVKGGKRKVLGIRASVYGLFLEYEEGLITYDEMVDLARACPLGERS